MKSQTALVARKCRLNEWARMVHDCKNRPAGMSVDEWCEFNSITKANYYYRMKQVRIDCLDALPSEESEHAVGSCSVRTNGRINKCFNCIVE